MLAAACSAAPLADRRDVDDEQAAGSPLGLYFARLWYYEELYPLVFALEGLAGARPSAGRARQ